MKVVKRIYLVLAVLIFAFLTYQCGENNNRYNSAEGNDSQTDNSAGAENSISNATVSLKGNTADGETYFDQTCAACHGMDAKGLPQLGKDLTTSKFVAGKTNAELLAFIKQGRLPNDPLNTTGVAMPPKGGNPALTDQQLIDIISYLRQIHK